jgi:hypothetical protein
MSTSVPIYAFAECVGGCSIPYQEREIRFLYIFTY